MKGKPETPEVYVVMSTGGTKREVKSKNVPFNCERTTREDLN